MKRHRKNDSHIERPLPLKDLFSAFRLVIEDDICTQSADVIAFGIASGRRNDFAATEFCQLNDYAAYSCARRIQCKAYGKWK